MEFIEGSDLSELLKRRKVPFPLAEVLRWADELLDALDYLHTQDPPVVHRDIKPPNIKLTPRGSVVLLDFGLAKGLPSQTDAGTASSIFGYSLSFAPLEQMQGSGTDTRSDLYSFAATLYHLLTGVRPPDALTRAGATVKQTARPAASAAGAGRRRCTGAASPAGGGEAYSAGVEPRLFCARLPRLCYTPPKLKETSAAASKSRHVFLSRCFPGRWPRALTPKCLRRSQNRRVLGSVRFFPLASLSL